MIVDFLNNFLWRRLYKDRLWDVLVEAIQLTHRIGNPEDEEEAANNELHVVGGAAEPLSDSDSDDESTDEPECRIC